MPITVVRSDYRWCILSPAYPTHQNYPLAREHPLVELEAYPFELEAYLEVWA